MPSRAGTDALAPVMARIVQGDESSFAQLYDATSRTVFGIVLRVLRDRAQAEEVVQEVYVEAWRAAARYDPSRGSAAAWLNTMAHRRAVDRVRSGQRRADREQRVFAESLADETPDPSDVVADRDQGGRVRDALAGLPLAQRQALVLAYFDGRTHREVAESLGIPLGTAKTRIRDALTRLRDDVRGLRD